MKVKRINTIAALCLSGSMLFSGCSFSGIADKILGHTEKTAEEDKTSESVQKSANTVDPTMEKPSFTVNLEGSVQFSVGSQAAPLTVEAAVNDGGTVTYQWYTNNVNANGGGDKIEGQTQNTFVPDTTEEGTRYYYVVATNNKDGSVTKSTSSTIEVQIVPEGNWVEENGLKKYQLFDGSFVTGTWKDIDGGHYNFDENGYMRTGWFQDGDGSWYFLNPDGTMAKDVEIEGFAIDSEGKSEAKKQAAEAEAAAQAEQSAQ
ncbi:hypothetical protein [Novisyntrophococcus fermenticellae]|uniref:hypothetical protein n=1 Tax=Novisyntrophococcus fermenticellae TaxID=2068655 RepID=UPI001E3D0895|nr:hypothetical protein [Novisyntrophococcus fermenticellae]